MLYFCGRYRGSYLLRYTDLTVLKGKAVYRDRTCLLTEVVCLTSIIGTELCFTDTGGWGLQLGSNMSVSTRMSPKYSIIPYTAYLTLVGSVSLASVCIIVGWNRSTK